MPKSRNRRVQKTYGTVRSFQRPDLVVDLDKSRTHSACGCPVDIEFDFHSCPCGCGKPVRVVPDVTGKRSCIVRYFVCGAVVREFFA